MTATRRLAAILAADVAGYSRLMGADEEGTLNRLKAIRAELIDPKIAAHRGRIVFGDGVNVAARLEALAEPGGICVSARVQEDAAGRLDLAFEDLGEQTLKNIARSVRVYRVRLGAMGSKSTALLTESAPVLALPDKPSIAVMPFANMSNDPEQEFFADGIAEDIITALSRYPSLFVIARNSCFTYKGRVVDVKEVGRDLGVRYVLEGSLRKSGNRIRVTARLVEAETGNHVWAERYHRDLVDIFVVQDEITEAVTVAIAPAISQAEQQRAMRKSPDSLDAWTAYQRGLWHLGKATAADNGLAEKFFQQAIELGPMFAGGYLGLSIALNRAGVTFQTRDPQEAQRAEEIAARRAVALDDTDGEARSRLAMALFTRGDHLGAQAEAERALVTCPNLAAAHGVLGVALTFSGRPREGLAALQTCIRLDPRAPTLINRMGQVAMALYFCREYEAALEAAARTIRTNPDFPPPYRWRSAALGQLGRIEEAKEALEQAITMTPTSFDMYVRNRVPRWRPEDHAHMIEGLRKAGWTG